MPRTNTTSQTTFTRPGSVTYQLNNPPSPSPFSSSTSTTTTTNPSLHFTTILLPAGSRWTSGLHWHETHTEYLQIMRGAARVTLDGHTATYTAKDGIVVVSRGCRHEWWRADDAGDELVVREWTDPLDGAKEVFFRNLNSAILDAGPSPTAAAAAASTYAWLLPARMKDFWLTMQLFVIFAELDNYPVLVRGPRWWGSSMRGLTAWVEWMVTHGVLVVVKWVGGWLGLRAVYEEYTPRELWVEYGVRRGLGKEKEKEKEKERVD